ncbi:hypothetical protein LTR17_023548 [Elasticomyces elasticus]|nr:hypothetical protein LTR17_023548 [Elasticomyces elasticus]
MLRFWVRRQWYWSLDVIPTHGTDSRQDLFTDNYIPNVEDRKTPLFSPLLVPTGQKGLPPSYFQICGMDPLRDEALIYERVLREEQGIKTKVDMYPGLPHGFWSIAPKLKVSEKFVEDSVKGAEWLLQQK